MLVVRQLYNLSHPFRAPAAFLAGSVIDPSANMANQVAQLHKHQDSYKKLSARTTVATVVLLTPYLVFTTYTVAGYTYYNFDFSALGMYMSTPFPSCVRAAIDVWFCCQNPIVLLVTTRALRTECRLWLLELIDRLKKYIRTRFTPTNSNETPASGEETVEQPRAVVVLDLKRSPSTTSVSFARQSEIRRRRTYDKTSIRRRGVGRTLSLRTVIDATLYNAHETAGTSATVNFKANETASTSATVNFEAHVHRLPNLRWKPFKKPLSHLPNVE